MSIIHKTTLTPTKLELLAAWLPGQPWYVLAGRAPELTKAGGAGQMSASTASSGGGILSRLTASTRNPA